MARQLTIVGTATITSGQTTSGWITDKRGFGHATDLVVWCPSALTAAVVVEVSHAESPSSADTKVLNIDGNDVAMGAGKAIVIPTSAFKSMRFVSAGAEGADRTFTVVAQVDMG